MLVLAACAPEQPEPASLLIEVSRRGRVTLDEIPVTVNELIEATTDRTAETVEVRADPDAIWMHVQWVLAALGEAGFKTARCAVEGARPVEIPVYSGRWFEKFPDFPEDWYLRGPQYPLEVVLSRSGTKYHLEPWPNPMEIVRDPRMLTERVRSLLRAPDIGDVSVNAYGSTSYRFVSRLLVALRGSGATRLDIGLEALHPWDRGLRTLPAPPSDALIQRWWTPSSVRYNLYPANLPVASTSVQDKDNDYDDRVILNLTATGRLILLVDHEPTDVTLAEFGAHLAATAQAYGPKMSARERTAFETASDGSRWSKLFVLLRADQDASWQHVRWVMAELSAARIYRLQFGTRIYAGPDLTPAQAERRWAAREIFFPPPMLVGKFSCYLATRKYPPDTSFVEVSVSGSPAQYTLGSDLTADADVLFGWVQAAEKALREDAFDVLCQIRAPSHTRFGAVVEALNAFHRVGIMKIDFPGLELAPEAVRNARRLPR